MDRRQFLYASLLSSILSGSISNIAFAGRQSRFAPLQNRVLLNLMMEGGPDFRHIIVPEYSNKPSQFGYHYWRARAASHGIADTHAAIEKYWQTTFVHRNSAQHTKKLKSGTTFGISKDCHWLIKMWDEGNAALICNAVGSTSRNHDFAVQVMKQGHLDAEIGDVDFSGWGGRLAHVAKGSPIRLNHIPSSFCNAPAGQDIHRSDTSKLITIADSRNIGLYETTKGTGSRSGYSDQTAARGMAAYYKSLHYTLPKQSEFVRFLEHEQTLRQFGGLIRERLAHVAIPKSIDNLLNKPDSIYMNGFAKQIRNAYDAIACNDILDGRVFSMECGDWDSHSGQQAFLTPMFNDVFGQKKGFDSLWTALSEINSKRDKLVIQMAGEFGRQLRNNGGNGTDHGSGNIMLVFGEKVNGGIYGELFPENEIDAIADKSVLNPDTKGLTEFDHVFGSVCDWVRPKSSAFVFPNRSSAKIERKGLLKNLFV